MKCPAPLTRLAQERVAAVVRPGDLVVDATVGNGHDTLFLARLVGPDGKVVGFDVQPRALLATRERLHAAGQESPVTLVAAGHERMADHLDVSRHGLLQAAMFNLGYLPGSDKTVTTGAGNTIKALETAWRALAPGGLLSVLCYRGHPGGLHEYEAVRTWAAQLPAATAQVETVESPGPVLVLVKRLTAAREDAGSVADAP